MRRHTQLVKPLLIAHRGDTINFPENSIAAFDSAFQKGAQGVELDLQEHAGELLVVHDYLYDTSKTYPRLEDVLSEFSKKGRLEIEIKSLDLNFLEPLKKLLQNYTDADIELTTSVLGILHYLRKEFPDLPLGVIFHEKEFEDWMFEEDFVITKVLKMLQLFKANVAHVPQKVASPELISKLHANNMKIHVHIPKQTIDEELRAYQTFQSLGIDQCTFDDINLANEIIE
jgi:glycerophosphoryl diester phosphodiesterase